MEPLLPQTDAVAVPRQTSRAPRRAAARHTPVRVALVLGLTLLAPAGAFAQQTQPAARQNPSPMVERTRAHERLPAEGPAGERFTLPAPLERPVQVYVPADAAAGTPARLLIHFHGAAYVAEHAVARAGGPYAAAVVNLGAGSRAYERPFSDAATFDALLAAIDSVVPGAAGREIVLSAFSAGYGAVRALLREPRHAARIRGIILLDGFHASYLPEGQPLAEGGAVDTAAISPFLEFARQAVAGSRTMLITHSEIFPGTFVSTTEATNLLLDLLGVPRAPVLAWGPVGMQQLSEARSGRFLVRGFAGNSAPDHIDHIHGLPDFLVLHDGL